MEYVLLSHIIIYTNKLIYVPTILQRLVLILIFHISIPFSCINHIFRGPSELSHFCELLRNSEALQWAASVPVLTLPYTSPTPNNHSYLYKCNVKYLRNTSKLLVPTCFPYRGQVTNEPLIVWIILSFGPCLQRYVTNIRGKIYHYIYILWVFNLI